VIACIASRTVEGEIGCMSRETIIQDLRNALLALTTDEKSVCQVAAERGVFCRGFRQHGDKELRQRYWWLERKNPGASRAELEQMANTWQLSQQELANRELSCDVQSIVHDTCGGFDDFSDQELQSFLAALRAK
jgi:hypothetical protein